MLPAFHMMRQSSQSAPEPQPYMLMGGSGTTLWIRDRNDVFTTQTLPFDIVSPMASDGAQVLIGGRATIESEEFWLFKGTMGTTRKTFGTFTEVPGFSNWVDLCAYWPERKLFFAIERLGGLYVSRDLVTFDLVNSDANWGDRRLWAEGYLANGSPVVATGRITQSNVYYSTNGYSWSVRALPERIDSVTYSKGVWAFGAKARVYYTDDLVSGVLQSFNPLPSEIFTYNGLAADGDLWSYFGQSDYLGATFSPPPTAPTQYQTASNFFNAEADDVLRRVWVIDQGYLSWFRPSDMATKTQDTNAVGYVSGKTIVPESWTPDSYLNLERISFTPNTAAANSASAFDLLSDGQMTSTNTNSNDVALADFNRLFDGDEVTLAQRSASTFSGYDLWFKLSEPRSLKLFVSFGPSTYGNPLITISGSEDGIAPFQQFATRRAATISGTIREARASVNTPKPCKGYHIHFANDAAQVRLNEICLGFTKEI